MPATEVEMSSLRLMNPVVVDVPELVYKGKLCRISSVILKKKNDSLIKRGTGTSPEGQQSTPGSWALLSREP